MKQFVKRPVEKTDEKKKLTRVCFRLVLLIPLFHVAREDWNVYMLQNIVAELYKQKFNVGMGCAGCQHRWDILKVPFCELFQMSRFRGVRLGKNVCNDKGIIKDVGWMD